MAETIKVVDSINGQLLIFDDNNWVNTGETILHAGLSPQVASGGQVADGTNAGTIKISSLKAFLRIADDVTAVLTQVAKDAEDNITLAAADTLYYLVLKHNEGTPTTTTQTAVPNLTTDIPLAKVYKEADDTVHWCTCGYYLNDGVAKLHRRIGTLRTLELATGCVMSDPNTRHLEINAGAIYIGLNLATPFSDANFNTNVADTFTTVYRDGIGGWIHVHNETQIDRVNYDNNGGAPQALQANKYGTHWVYVHPYEDHVYIVYGQSGTDTFAEAEANEPIIALPILISEFGCLIGKIIVKKNTDTLFFYAIKNTAFGVSAAASHSNLSGLDNVADHPGYSLIDGSRDFTNPVIGVDPVGAQDLATKNYIDTNFIDTAALEAYVEPSTAAGQLLFAAGGNWNHSEITEMFWDDTKKGLGIGAGVETRGEWTDKLRLAVSGTRGILAIGTYSAEMHASSIELHKSRSDTIGTNTTTLADDGLGGISFTGVSNANNRRVGASISVSQSGGAGPFIGARMSIQTYSDAGTGAGQLVLYRGTKIGINMGFAGTPATALDVNGDVTISNDLEFRGVDTRIRNVTVDGSDNASMILTAAGAAGTTRGAYIRFYGNEHANSGDIRIYCGEPNGNIQFRSNGNSIYIQTTGELDLDTHKIINVVDPAANQDAATKKYVDDQIPGASLWEIDGAETQLKVADEIDMQTKKIINVTDPADNQDAATKKYVDDNAGALAAYPVGAIYLSVVDTSPQTLFGGTWVSIGAGRVLIGLDDGDTDFDTVEETGGVKTHSISEAEMASHEHKIKAQDTVDDFVLEGHYRDDGVNWGIMGGTGGRQIVTDIKGEDTAHTNVQPYLVVYMWKRTV